MKILLLSIATLSCFSAWSQCPAPTCTNIVLVNQNLQNMSYNGNQCFLSYDMTIVHNSVNWNNFQQLSFNGKFKVKQSINLNNQATLFSTGENIFDYITMTGGNIIYVDGQTEIKDLISNNSFSGQYNIIYTNNPIKVKNNTYYIGDTIYTAQGTGNNVIVKTCTSTPLPINNISLTYYNNTIYWTVETKETYYLEASIDGYNFTKVCELTPKGKVIRDPKMNYYRIDNKVLKLAEHKIEQYTYYDFFTGRQIEKPTEFYIEKQGQNVRKVLILK